MVAEVAAFCGDGRMWWGDERKPATGDPETRLEHHLRLQHSVRPSMRWALTAAGRAKGVAAGWTLPDWDLPSGFTPS